jgi:minor extracellular serine protease Vpr
MSYRRLARGILYFLLTGAMAFAGPLSEKQYSKLHPYFQAVVAKTFPDLLQGKGGWSGPYAKSTINGVDFYRAIVFTDAPGKLSAAGIHINSVYPGFVTALLRPADLASLAAMESVRYIDPGKIRRPFLDVSVPETGATLVHSGLINNTSYTGRGSIVLIYDTGIDWRHPDFRSPLDTTKSRILFIWDQTLTPIAGESSPGNFSYGVEYSKAQIDDELAGKTHGAIRDKDIVGHGTHVASTAAGNGLASGGRFTGMAPDADIIVVKGSDSQFSETSEIDALTYAASKAAALGEPVVVNMSLGGVVGAHDGTEPDEVAVDNFVQTPGRAVCIAAGNDGDHLDHFGGTVANGSPATIQVSIPAYTPSSGTDNNAFVIDVWLPTAQTMSITATSPNSITYTCQSGATVTGQNSSDGTIDLLSASGNQTSNGHRDLQLYVHNATSSNPRPGTWTVTLNTTGSAVSFDAWLDNNLGGASASFPSGDRVKNVAMPGTARGAITVGSYVTKWYWTSYDGSSWEYGGTDRTGNISTFSSTGPTADGRQKPDIAAPGQGIVAALSGFADTTGSFSSIVPGRKYILMQGTSMATPHATGACALMLGARPSLTAAALKDYLTSESRNDAFTGTTPNTSWGYGKMDIYYALASALGAQGANRATLNYYSGTIVGYTNIPTTNQKVAVRFTPTLSGPLSEVAVTPNGGLHSVGGTGNLKITATQSLPGSIAGIPGPAIGNSVSVPLQSLTPGSSNVIDFSSAGVSVSAGTDFQLVIEATNSDDTLNLLLDDGSLNIDRTSSYRIGANGVLGWYNRADPQYASGYTPSHDNLLVTASIAAQLTGVDGKAEVPHSFELMQNYPNPFNPGTSIEYTLAVKAQTTLEVFNILGQKIATLVDGVQEAGLHRIYWSAKTGNGPAISSGVYFYRLKSGAAVQTRTMLYIK